MRLKLTIVDTVWDLEIRSIKMTGTSWDFVEDVNE